MKENKMNYELKDTDAITIYSPRYYNINWDIIESFDEMKKMLSIIFGGVQISDGNKHFNDIERYLIKD